jgi:hypothetical protein
MSSPAGEMSSAWGWNLGLRRGRHHRVQARCVSAGKATRGTDHAVDLDHHQ